MSAKKSVSCEQANKLCRDHSAREISSIVNYSESGPINPALLPITTRLWLLNDGRFMTDVENDEGCRHYLTAKPK